MATAMTFEELSKNCPIQWGTTDGEVYCYIEDRACCSVDCHLWYVMGLLKEAQ